MDREQFDRIFRVRYVELSEHPPSGFTVLDSGSYYDDVPHPGDFTDYECAWAAGVIRRAAPERLLDVGSYRHFIYGLASAFDVTSVDLRMKLQVPNVKLMARDARDLTAEGPDGVGRFDMIVSLSSLEHVGLGRYGDRYEVDGDRLAFAALKGLLALGGVFAFSVPVNGEHAVVFYNAHRVYTVEMVRDMCAGLTCVSETYFSFVKGAELEGSALTRELGGFDVYCGAWRKEGAADATGVRQDDSAIG